MARKNREEALADDEPGADVSSLIDICFLLLIYFLVASTIQAKEQDVDMALPSPGAGPPSDQPPMFIQVDPQGIVYVGTGPAQEMLDQDAASRNLPLLDQRLSVYSNGASAAGSTPVVQMYVDGEAKQQRVVDVLNLLAKYKIGNVTFTDLID